MAKRTPYRSFTYRPLIPLFKELIQWSEDKGNHVYEYNPLNEMNGAFRGNNGEHRHARFIDDILVAPTAQKNITEMNHKHDSMVNTTLNPNLLNKSFLISEFYDGGLLFKRHNKTTSIWPLVMSILNCDPHDRLTPGIGMFMIALHDLSIGKPAEKAIFTQLFVPELQKLGEGLLFDISSSNGPLQVFLQVRLILHVLDTKAYEDISELQGKTACCYYFW